MKIWRTSLMARLASYYLILSLVTITLIGLLTYNQARRTLEEGVYERLNSVAILKEDDLQRWIAARQEDVTFIANLPSVRLQALPLLRQSMAAERAESDIKFQETHDDLVEFLSASLAQKPAFLEILILTDIGGKIIASTDANHEGQYRVLDTYFVEGKEGLFTQGVYPSPVTGRPTVTISTPLVDDQGVRLGVLAAHLNLAQMNSIVLTHASLGETGEIYTVDAYNVFVSGTEFGRENFPRGVHTLAIDTAVKGRQGKGLYANYAGVPVIGVYRWLDDLDLALLAEMSQAEAFKPARSLASTILVVGVLTAVALAIGVYLLIRKIALPINSLTETAIQVASGDLTPVAPESGEDEIGLLSRAFNDMTTRLRLLYAGLETKVAELEAAETSLQQYARRLEAQHEIDSAILAAQSSEAVAAAALDHLQRLIPASRSSVTLFHQEENQAVVLAAKGVGESYYRIGQSLPVNIFDDLHDLNNGKPRFLAEGDSLPNPSSIRNLLAGFNVNVIVIFPMLWRKQLIGTLNLGSDDNSLFDEQNLAITHEVANQLAVAIQQTQLFAATQRQLEELSVLHAVAKAAVEASDEESLIAQVTKIIGQSLYTDNFGVILTSDSATGLIVTPSYQGIEAYMGNHTIPDGIGISNQVVKTGKALRISDVTQEPNYYEAIPGVRSELCVPLKVGERIIGVINAESSDVDAFTREDERLLTTIAGQLATAIEKFRLFDTAQTEIVERRRVEKALRQARDGLEIRVAERTAELTLLNHAGRALISSLDQDQILVTVLGELRNLLKIVACSVWLVDPNSRELVCRQSSGPAGDNVRGTRLLMDKGIVGWSVRHGRSIIIPDAQKDERHYQQLDDRMGSLPRSLLTVPFILQGRVIGALQALDTEIDRFDESDLALMESLAATAAFAIENARLFSQAQINAETREILLREVNHRVKNNLSAIIGLLYAERRHAEMKNKPVYQSIMQDLISRVQGLAAVHDLLSVSEWAPVSLVTLIQEVVHSSLQGLPPDKHMHVTVQDSDIRVTPNQANYLALVVNEVTTNAMKYALQERAEGNLSVTAENKEGTIVLEFTDDGPGYPEDVLAENSPRYNVGFHLLINIISRSLNGSLMLKNGSPSPKNGRPGAITTIAFNLQVPPIPDQQSIVFTGEAA